MASTSKKKDEPVGKLIWNPQFTALLTYAAERLKQDVGPVRANTEDKAVNTVCSISSREWLFRDGQKSYNAEERAEAVACELIERASTRLPYVEEKKA